MSPLQSRVDGTVSALEDRIRELGEQKLPTESVLQRELNVSRSTLREALARLEATGAISRHGRAGTYVNPAPRAEHAEDLPLGYPVHLVLSLSDFLSRAKVHFEVREIRILKQAAEPELRRVFALEDGAEVYVATRVYEVNGGVAAHLEHVLPTTLGGPTLQVQHLAEGMVTFLEEVEGIAISHVECRIAAEAAPEELASLLQLSSGAPVLVMRTQIYGPGEKALALGRLTFRSDRLALSVNAKGHWSVGNGSGATASHQPAAPAPRRSTGGRRT